MSSNFHPIAVLKSAFRAFFQQDLVLQRESGRLHVALAEPASADKPRPPSRAEKAAKKEAEDLVQARADLAALLDEEASLRSTMRHLAFIEQALAKKGWKALHKVPLDVLQRAHQQLENLVTNWSAPGLACLRSKMAVAVLDREHQDVDAETDAYRTAAVLDSPQVVAEQAIEAAKISSAEDESAALLATYAAMGIEAPGGLAVEVQGELGSPSAKALSKNASRIQPTAADVTLRDLPV